MTRDLCPTCNGAGGQRILRRWYEGGEPVYDAFNIQQHPNAVIVEVASNERTDTEPAEHVEALEQLDRPFKDRTVVLCPTCSGTGVA